MTRRGSGLAVTAALCGSTLLHAAGLVALSPGEEIRMAGGAGSVPVRLGDGFADLAAGTLTPVGTGDETGDAATPDTIAPMAALDPVAPGIEQPETAPPGILTPATTDMADLPAPAEAVAAELAVTAALADGAATPPGAERLTALTPADAASSLPAAVLSPAAPTDPAAIPDLAGTAAREAAPEPDPAADVTLAVVSPAPDNPRPAPRPDRDLTTRTDAQPEPMATAKAATAAAASAAAQVRNGAAARMQAAAGAGAGSQRGNGDRNERRGAASGTETGIATRANGTAGAGEAPGNGATENYGGKVLRRILATRKAKAPAEGVAIVGFTIAPDGTLARVRMMRSSGSAELDAVALDHIRRAAPFPKPPGGLKKEWSFVFEGRG